MMINRERLLSAMQQVYPLNQLNQDQLETLADKAEALVYKSGKIIFQQGSLGEYLYLVIEGDVEILREQKGKISSINTYHPKSVFGYDAISTDPVRSTSARSLKDSLVIRLSASIVNQLLEQSELIHDVFKLIIRSYRLMTRVDLEGRKPDETIQLVGRSFPLKLALFFLISSFSIAVLGGILPRIVFPVDSNIINALFRLSLIGLLIVVVNLIPYINWRESLFFITDQRVILKELSILTSENRHEMGMDEIVSVANRTNFLGRLLGFGDLLINSYTGNLGIKIVHKASLIQQLLEYVRAASSQNKRLNQIEKDDALIANRIGLNNQPMSTSYVIDLQGDSNSARNKETGFLEKLFGMRIIIGDTIHLRTHWIELVKKTLIPAVLLLSFCVFLGYMSEQQIPWAANLYIFILTVVLIVIGLFWWLYQLLDWRNDRFIITADQIIDIEKKPLGLEDKRAAPIRRIQSIRYKRQGLAGLMFNYGTVYIRIGDDELTFDHVHDPLYIQQEIFDRLERIKNSDEEKMVEHQRDQALNLIEAYHRMTPPK